MNSELPKNYEPASVEENISRTWLAEKAFAANPAASGEPYCIVIPPPNVTGALHLGHALNNTLQDILIRYHRMRGFNVLWVPGIDHAGIATQAVVEKQLKEKENKTRHDVGREALVQRIWQWKEQYGNRILEQLKRLGCSCDWERTRFTLDEQCAAAVRETFFKLFGDGLVYRGKRLVNWDIFLQTSVSDDEIYHETVKTHLWHIAYPIDGSDKKMVVATTRPETMLGDTAVAVHSSDARWNWAIGQKVRLPLVDRLIPIIADDILVDPKFGSGVVKVTPAHDPNDYAVWQRHLGQPDAIDIINILHPDGTLNDNAGIYQGMRRDKARRQIVEDLRQRDLLIKEEPYETQVGHSDRSKTPIEPYLSDQWFIKMAPLAEPALEVVRRGLVRFHPQRHAQQYLAWLGEKRDWPISRQLWWGHRIPIWTREFELTEPLNSLTESAEPISPPATAALRKALGPDAETVLKGGEEHILRVEAIADRPDWMRATVCVRREVAAMQQVLEKCGFEQDADVLDTWFSSALWPHSTLGWPRATAELAKWNPTSVLVTARDIITLWVARMVMMNLYNMGQGRWTSDGQREAQAKIASDPEAAARFVPFHDVAINPTILDGKGERMSKSKGNGVDPVEIIDTHGADALRFTLAQMATETQDVRLPVKKLADGRNTSEKFEMGRNFCNKLWNAARFAMTALAEASPATVSRNDLSLPDRWILSRLGQTIAAADLAIKTFRFDQYAKAVYDFVWGDFCDWYVETLKPVLKGDARPDAGAAVLAAVLDASLRLLHPVMPFITERLWWQLNEVCPQRGVAQVLDCPTSARLIHASWPTAPAVDQEAETLFERLMQVITAIRNLRNQHNVEAKKAITIRMEDAQFSAQDLMTHQAIIELLANCLVLNAQTPPPGTSAQVQAGGCLLTAYGLSDPDAERQRLAKRREELVKQIAALEARLANPNYSQKAPPQLVQQTRSQLSQAQAELGGIQ